ncbi:protein naked cuticle homolog [Pectinophora gossypiella]|uniref:protein naked cuticle homolog n=1 Tax=Pectinophora gossypiella TaxID=13191 RepID=UPI00214EFDD2|nr:protein naked cuticle homolog [Pectinophora gossypiella]
MTCYETLRAPAPAADAPMAHHFVKWWRNKFRNGYKKFSIGTESERTDTEELVGRAASQCSAPPDLLPSEARALLQPTTPPPRAPPVKTHEPTYKSPPSPAPADNHDDKPRLRFEELTCDVELQHPEPSKQQPLQFSFTLYDLDGHGRMTKDDIAGIVSTIYESIGKSVTVPHYGSKTIQVRLTVVPEDGSSRSQRERRDARRRRRKEPAQTAPTPPECEHTDEDQRERLSHDDDVSSKSSCSGDRRLPQRPAPTHHRSHRHTRKEHRERRHTKKRSGSLQRRELLEIIQANMEKNHLSFQASRKPPEPVANEEEITSKYQKLRNRSYTVSEKPLNAFQKLKSENPGNGYLDLASGGDSNLCRYDRYLHAVICSSARHAHTGYHQKQAQTPRPARAAHAPHPRSRSHDLPTQAQQPRVLQIIFL